MTTYENKYQVQLRSGKDVYVFTRYPGFSSSDCVKVFIGKKTASMAYGGDCDFEIKSHNKKIMSPAKNAGWDAPDQTFILHVLHGV